ncbi:MAG: CBS domain-containing protein [Elusimicrobia bacterium]|nr:CBS domain-containing protein [Elusimicrobiota bacterium]
MSGYPSNFTYLSYIIGIPVIDAASGRQVGRVVDMAAGLREMFPRISGAMISRGGWNGARAYLPWKNVKSLELRKALVAEGAAEAFAQEPKLGENEILIKETFWDKQIVDIHGCKVVRVNDLHLLREDQNLWVVHMDVGIPGLLRRLGCFGPCDWLFKLVFSVPMREKFISWKFVQPITSTIGSDALALKVHHSKLSELHPADLAEIFIDLGTDERLLILQSLDDATAAQAFQEMPLSARVQMAETIPEGRLAGLVDGMAMDEVVDLVAQLPKKKKDALLRRLPAEKVAQVKGLLEVSRRVAGSIMNTAFLSVRRDATAAQVLEQVKAEAKRVESIYHTYVLDENDELVGVVTLRQLLTAPADAPVAGFMRKRVVRVALDTNIKDVADIFLKYDFTVLPVVDRRGRVQGTITMKDSVEAVFQQVRSEAEVVK